MKFWLFLYNLFLILGFFFYLPFSIFRKKDLRKDFRRFFLPGGLTQGLIWVQAVSVGEVMASLPLIRRLEENFPGKVLLSVTTSTGYKVASSISNINITYFPLDFPLVIERFIKRVNPLLFISLETEVWPNLLYHLKRRGIPSLLVNGRLSDHSFQGYRLFRPFFRRVFNLFSLLAMRSEKDAKNLFSLGIDKEKVVVTGNLKFDLAISLEGKVDIKRLRERLSFPEDRPVVIFGSIHQPEEKTISEVCTIFKEKAYFIIAPRHPEKSRLGYLLNEKGLSFSFYSNPVRSEVSNGTKLQKSDIVILDTIGELSYLYSVSDLAFVGGSLFDWGGQNILEPAAFSKPVLFGPYISNFEEEARVLLEKGGAKIVKDKEELIFAIKRILSSPEEREEMGENAYKALLSGKGATERNFNLIKRFLTP